MPVTTSFPGIYIEELPSTAHTITAAPTSLAVFIGYTHPYKTQTFDEAVEVFNFTDYQRAFGGLYANDALDANVAYAVQQFFLNGGSVAYVVGIQSGLFPFTAAVPAIPPAFALPPQGTPPAGDLGNIHFSGLEPVDAAHLMSVTVTNVAAGSLSADLTITYGSVAETFRNVSLTQGDPNFIERRLNGISTLVWVSPVGGSYQTYPAANTKVAIVYAVQPVAPAFNPVEFIPVFQADASLDKVAVFNLMIVPGVTDPGIWAQAIAFCERKRAFLIMDPPPDRTADGANGSPKIEDFVPQVPESTNSALYFPYLTASDALSGGIIRLPPSGYVAGVFARIDNNRGVWKAPAGLETTLVNATGVVPEGRLTDARAGVLNPLGVNCLRTFPGSGTVVFGARTTVTANPAFQQWRYVPVRRMALFIEQTLFANLGWVVFEPNDEPLWVAIRMSIEAFMLTLFHQGALQGATPSAAFLVKCDASTTTPTDVDNGIVNILVAFAPLKPAEFVVIQIAQLAGQVQS